MGHINLVHDETLTLRALIAQPSNRTQHVMLTPIFHLTSHLSSSISADLFSGERTVIFVILCLSLLFCFILFLSLSLHVSLLFSYSFLLSYSALFYWIYSVPCFFFLFSVAPFPVSLIFYSGLFCLYLFFVIQPLFFSASYSHYSWHASLVFLFNFTTLSSF